MPDERTISIRIFRVNNFFLDCCHPLWAMTSGRFFPAAPQNRGNKIGRGFRNKSCLWSWQRQGHQTQVIPSKPVRRRHPCLGRPGPPQRPQRRGRVDGRSGTGDFLFHLRGRIRGHPWRADVVLFITRMDGTLSPQQHWQFRLNARHPLRHQNPGRPWRDVLEAIGRITRKRFSL